MHLQEKEWTMKKLRQDNETQRMDNEKLRQDKH
jgi:hypothetical protein